MYYSICTTRSVTGHGIPQVTAIFEVWRAVRDFGEVLLLLLLFS